MRDIIRKTIMVAVTALTIAASATTVWAQAEVSAGYDLFTTDPTSTDLLGIPFVGDAGARPTFDFLPPPDSADGRRAIGDTDTIVHRMETASVATIPGTADPITIELVMLRLVSTMEFDLDGDGTMDGFLYVTLQKDRDPAGEVRRNFDPPPPPPPEVPPPPFPGFVEEDVLPGPRSFGVMAITFDSTNGGTFDSHLDIYADLRIGSPDGPIVCGENAGLPACDDFDAALSLTSNGSAWSRDAVPESITIWGVNYSLAAPDRNTPVDTSTDFWAGIDPHTSTTVCVAHGGHPDPGGLPTAHGTCRTRCSTQPITIDSCRNSRDDDCNGTIDDCAEDVFGPVVNAPGQLTFECPQTDVSPTVAGFATGTDNCFPSTLPAGNITYSDFVTPRCGPTFDVDRVWTATDDCGNNASMPDLQQIFVVDTTDPVITSCPMQATILWTHDRSPNVLGFATGADTCSDDADVGIGFGDTVVLGACLSEDVTRTWTATDECSNDTTCDQPIFVRGPKDAIEDLDAVLAGMGLDPRFTANLSRRLGNAVNRSCDNNAGAAVNQLTTFIQQVTNQIGRQISAADAAILVNQATAIIDALNTGGACPNGCGFPTTPPTTVIIGGCDTGVADVILSDGRTLSEAVDDCDANARNHGQFVSCVEDILNDLVQDGAISGSDRQAIQGCL